MVTELRSTATEESSCAQTVAKPQCCLLCRAVPADRAILDFIEPRHHMHHIHIQLGCFFFLPFFSLLFYLCCPTRRPCSICARIHALTPPAEKVESIYDRIEQTLDTINKSETCSLRRTRSLAVIREETFNDLQIGGGIRSRRSQLIPRAKLLNRSFFQNRYRLVCSKHFSIILSIFRARFVCYTTFTYCCFIVECATLPIE